MSEALKLEDFDVLGIIKLTDIKGIERYVTPIINESEEATEYLSRSKEYYNVKSMTELSFEREQLKKLLTNEISKKNFVILENMLNYSAKVYFKKLENYIISNKNENIYSELKQAEECLLEDTKNILTIFHQKELMYIDTRNVLPRGLENAEKRFIEMDNKSWLYIFAKSLDASILDANTEVVIPGYGGLYIGPFLKVMYGCNYTNILKSKYIKDTSQLSKFLSIKDVASSDMPFKDGKKVLLLDDNVGTGQTMKELKKELQKYGVNSILTGAIQYNWRNYYRVSIGEKKDIERFEPTDFDLLTPINYAGNKLYKHAVDRLHASGNEYLEYLKVKSYQKDDLSDLRGQIDRGILCARMCDLDLMPGYEYKLVSYSYPKKDLIEKYKISPTEISNPISKQLINNIIENIEEAERVRQKDNR